MENTAKNVAGATRRTLSGDNRKLSEIAEAFRSIGVDAVKAHYRAALEKEPKLAECGLESLAAALIQAAYLKLTPEQVSLGLRQDGDTGRLKCVFHVKPEGFFELARRCGGEAGIS
jgi:recombinational DNA repair protein RecT